MEATRQPCEGEAIEKLADSPDIQKSAELIYSNMRTPFDKVAYAGDVDSDRRLIALGIATERQRSAKTAEAFAFNKCEFTCDLPFELGKKIRSGE